MVEAQYLLQRHPANLMRFITARQWYPVIDLDKKAGVVMLVTLIVLTGRDGVHVHIEDVFTQQLDLRRIDTGFFRGLLQCHADDITLAIGMAAGLQPEIQLAVMQHQYMAARRIDHPG